MPREAWPPVTARRLYMAQRWRRALHGGRVVRGARRSGQRPADVSSRIDGGRLFALALAHLRACRCIPARAGVIGLARRRPCPPRLSAPPAPAKNDHRRRRRRASVAVPSTMYIQTLHGSLSPRFLAEKSRLQP